MIARLIITINCILPATLTAQTFSYDGNRWYEIEVSIFTNENADAHNELVIPEKHRLFYPEPIHQLTPASSGFMIPFRENSVDERLESLFDNTQSRNFNSEQNRALQKIVGPEEFKGESDFRLMDFRRSPYIALGQDTANFTRDNRSIEASVEHRLLFHAVWRQPVLNRAQADAIFVAGGSSNGIHTELEGSLRFSYDINRVDVEARLWLLTFGTEANALGQEWTIPLPPFVGPALDNPTLQSLPAITSVAIMNQEREMISNELHYLDHPDLGVLVEIRPYQLPEVNDFSFE